METERFVSFVKSVIKSQPIPPHYNPDAWKGKIYIEEGKDFHFIRQDSDGNWSEKDGMYGKIRIVNPENINKNRDSYEFVGVFMITKKE